MNILFTCVGRRVELVQSFKSIKGTSLNIIGTDCESTAPALFFCDQSFIIPRISSPEYIPSLIKICKDNQVDLVIPTIDTDLYLLSLNADKFLEIGTKVLISKPDKIAICRDKRKTADFFVSLGLKTPYPTDDISKYNQGYPAFIKPKDGSSSINTYKVTSFEELKEISKRVPEYIVAPFIEGKEFTIDCFCDFDGKPIFIVPRIRLAVRSGEVLKTQICLDEKIINEAKRIIEEFKPVGPITIQLIQDSKTKDDYFIEINPRFGGGAPLSFKAGANSPKEIVNLLKGKRVSYKSKNIKDGAIYARFDQSVRVL